MARIRFTGVQARPAEFLDLTSLTLDEFQSLVPLALKPHSKRIWLCGGSMRHPRPRAGFRCTRTVPCRHPRIGYSSFSPT